MNDEAVIRKIVEKNFTWGDLNPKYDNIQMLKTNVFCPLHDHNYTEGNAKFYYNSDKDIWTLYCFVERKVFSAYDYLKKVLCEERQYYSSPLAFLKEKMPESEILRQYKLIQEQDIDIIEDKYERKKEYIDNVFDEAGNIVDYIEELYCA